MVMATAQASALSSNTHPIGAGGVLGHLGRMIIMVCTFGFVYPNAFIEGMNATEYDRQFWKD